jgi:hypothetical protein
VPLSTHCALLVDASVTSLAFEAISVVSRRSSFNWNKIRDKVLNLDVTASGFALNYCLSRPLEGMVEGLPSEFSR